MAKHKKVKNILIVINDGGKIIRVNTKRPDYAKSRINKCCERW